MRAIPVFLCGVLLLACACGKGSSPSAAPPAAPEPGGDATTSQPGAPPPSPSPSPSPSSPSPSPSPSPDRFVTVERVDSDAECDGLVPQNVPAPVTATTSPPPGGGCGRGLSEGTGHVAAATQFFPGGAQWQVFGPDGAAEQRFSVTSDVWPQPEGWQGVRANRGGTPETVDVLTFFADGSARRSETPSPSGFGPRVSIVAPDPRGGSLVVLWGPTGSSMDPTCLGEARRFDATGAPSGAPARTGCDVAAVGVSTGGEALVLERAAGGGALLRWLNADGTAAVDPGHDASAPPFQLQPLLDGSLVGLQGTTFTRRYPHLGAASEPAAAWLAGRGNQTFRFTRGNRGYAFFPPASQQSPDCTQVVELLAPSGRRCVKLTFRRDGNACVTGGIDQGWDGTVVEQTSLGACGWRFWPRLLAGD